ncbi:LutC/YkgG family protein [Paracoccus aerodenitrificans]|uniref:LutC/YkgG family protein n=1 Tax=Paracoccus aerodenitrificans TaxID=3017781 RepID=UPI0022F11688|nr:LUD domain-containing protein [Paracoccus aerodenitrificans]WBU62816.1 LUD domain-containing protein [Paracoccus aerodenitrificans]
MTARDDIFRAISQGLTRGQGGAVRKRSLGEIRAEAAALLHHPDEIRPALSGQDPVAAFIAKCAMPALGVSLARVPDVAGLASAVAEYLKQHDLPNSVAITPDPLLAGLDRGGIETHPDCAPDEAVAISVADWAVAETGSVVIHSSATQPILHAMLPRHWLVVVKEARILPFLDDYATYAALRPRNAVMITGSSGTTDIEGYFVRGAHGPGFVHVLLVST